MKLKRILFLVAFAILVFALGIAYVKLAEHDALLLLHFDSYRGRDVFGSRTDVFSVIFIGMGMVLLNYLLARAAYVRRAILAYVLGGASVFFALLIFIALLVIISVN